MIGAKMIDYNLILYIGLFLLIFGFILFVVSEIRIRQIDKELFRQEQLHKSFMKAKNFIPIQKEQIQDIEKELRTQKGRKDENRS